MSTSRTIARKAFIRLLLRNSLIAATWLPPILFINTHVVTIAAVKGESMSPALNPKVKTEKDLVLLDMWTIKGPLVELKTTEEPIGASPTYVAQSNIQRGDVVVLKSPMNPENKLVKRVLALEGDQVVTRPPYPRSTVRIPAGHVWVEGDERFHSRDSNEYGPVSVGLITARVACILWPFERFGAVPKGGRLDYGV
ncbi:Mitochondrial inner membrane protease subunit 2 [Neolecta irregularis DAH-3]|uniref:Mitochondrial inner membrane protease subunit n=1 Tax=Neolecta irregularis (strain DAH-3) TaxID=1198029 RepID=A0A1U7LWG7_NEOID|nr:Mitochondrial inner membrane protease subunit 2 [Neolecta irregularis DAH-3]|eukprot:OLL27025.1 Mitochondrial inner membrane protease subunit 2 [Neolecta irregularis DAH-3]